MTDPTPGTGWGRLPRWSRILLAWGGVATFFVLQSVTSALSRGRPIDPLLHVANEYGYWLTWALLTPAILAVIARHPFETRRRHDLLVHLVAMGLIGLLQVALADAIEYGLVMGFTPADAPIRPGFGSRLFQGAPFDWFTFAYKYWAVVGIVLAAQYRRRWEERAVTAARLEAGLARAHLASLRGRLEPHFLHNALHTVGMLCLTDPPAATRVVTRLSELLRRAIDLPEDQWSRLDEELDFVDRYLEIERARFGDRLQVELTAPDELLAARVPALVLQPLVENAVRHGLGRRAAGGTLRIGASAQAAAAGRALVLEVADDGPGFAPEARPGAVGLGNLRERLARLYEGRARLELPAPGAPAVVRVHLPLPA